MKFLFGLLMATVLIAIPARGFAREVEFNWQPVAAALKYEIQVATDDAFGNPLQSTQVEKPEFTMTLGTGQYFYRVRVIDRRMKPGRWSKPEPVTVLPYAPEPVSPEDGFATDYFEIPPEIEFTWKAAAETGSEYEILVMKSSGEKALEEKTTETTFKTDKLGEGDYLWKVRTIEKKTFASDYTAPRRFKIVKKPMDPPVLLQPADNGVAPAYRPVKFKWKQDPHARYADITYEKIKGQSGSPPGKKTISDFEGTEYTADYEEPGEYSWSVKEKEGKNTPGLLSPDAHFEVRNDVISRGNYELEFSLSSASDLYTTNSARQTNGSNFISQQSNSNGLFTGFLAGYYPLEGLGFFVSTRSAEMGVENVDGREQETDLSMRLRFGVKGFSQEFIYGLRVMDLLEAENTPAQETTDFTAIGPLLGTRIRGTIVPNWRFELQGYYFKPTSNMEGISGFTGDVFGYSIGLKWNFMYQFWLGYRFQSERVNASFVTPGQQPGVNAGWTMYRTEPLYFSISFEH